MLTKNFVITCPVGLHARPVSALVAIAGSYSSDITIRYKEKTVPMASIIGVMTLGAATGETVEVTVSGDDEGEAMQRLDDFFEKELQEL